MSGAGGAVTVAAGSEEIARGEQSDGKGQQTIVTVKEGRSEDKGEKQAADALWRNADSKGMEDVQVQSSRRVLEERQQLALPIHDRNLISSAACCDYAPSPARQCATTAPSPSHSRFPARALAVRQIPSLALMRFPR